MTNWEDTAGNGGVGEGEREDGGGGRSTTKLVGIKNNNQPIMVVTINRGVRTQQAIEQQYGRQGKREMTAGGEGA